MLCCAADVVWSLKRGGWMLIGVSCGFRVTAFPVGCSTLCENSPDLPKVMNGLGTIVVRRIGSIGSYSGLRVWYKR